jgi:hypothetical protein
MCIRSMCISVPSSPPGPGGVGKESCGAGGGAAGIEFSSTDKFGGVSLHLTSGNIRSDAVVPFALYAPGGGLGILPTWNQHVAHIHKVRGDVVS